MIDIPRNDATDIIAQKNARHQELLDYIANQFLAGLKGHDSAKVDCTPHMIGYQGSREYHHLEDTLEVARMFKKKGYYCYYYNGYNKGGVNQRAVFVCKAPKTDAEIHCYGDWTLIPV